MEYLPRASEKDEPDEMVVAGIAKYLHDFYQGVERIFERIAVHPAHLQLRIGVAEGERARRRTGRSHAASAQSVGNVHVRW